jgi:hypothetical protein
LKKNRQIKKAPIKAVTGRQEAIGILGREAPAPFFLEKHKMR